jgi:hypothetical protein
MPNNFTATTSDVAVVTITPTPSPTPTPKPSNNTGAIAGGVVGGLAVLGLAIGGVIFLLMRRKKNKSPDTGHHNADIPVLQETSYYKGPGGSTGNAPAQYNQPQYNQPQHQPQQAYANQNQSYQQGYASPRNPKGFSAPADHSVELESSSPTSYGQRPGASPQFGVSELETPMGSPPPQYGQYPGR